MKEKIANSINILGNFCGKRDISALTREELKSKYNIEQADVMVLFGGSILCGGDILGTAINNKVAKKYIIVGGAGHTTEALRIKMHTEVSEIETKDLPEAEIFNAYLKYKYGVQADYLECNSTNCGNNITYLLELVKENQIPCKTMIISQDATMQYRMEAALRKYVKDMEIINFATYKAKVIVQDSDLAYDNDIWGMWDIERYISLLMGEVVRLSDNENGYGPKGQDYIVHVDIPVQVEEAFSVLKEEYPDMVRGANPLYA